jgi:DNA-binding LytR/AlgR family response regulator
MDCIIIDDEITAREIIKQLCSNQENINIVREFGDAISAIKFLNENNIDLIFLDIHMPDFNGIDFIKTLKNPPQLILTTSDPNFAASAFEFDFIVDYILKPIDMTRFQNAIARAENRLLIKPKDTTSEKVFENQEKYLYVNINKGLKKINLNDILFIEAKGDYIIIVKEKERTIVHSSLKKILEVLPDIAFIQVHRSYIININHILDIKDNGVNVVKNIIPIGRQYKSKLFQQLNLL